MTVDSLDFTSGDEGVPLLSGSAFRVIDRPNPLPGATPAGERLSFEIWVRQAEEYSISLSDLGFATRSRTLLGRVADRRRGLSTSLIH